MFVILVTIKADNDPEQTTVLHSAVIYKTRYIAECNARAFQMSAMHTATIYTVAEIVW